MAASPATRCATPRASRAASYTTEWGTTLDGVMRLSRAQFEALFEGLDWKRVMARRVAAPVVAG